MVCLYGFVPPASPAPPPELRGLEGGTLEELQLNGFRAIFSRLDDAEYSPARIEERMKDLSWVAARGLDHERVVAWFVDHGQILPVPLFTLYTGPEALRAAADSHAGTVVAQLDRFAGRQEWDLKITFQADRLEAALGTISEEVARLDAEIAAAPPGRRYLLEKKRSAVAKVETSSAARRLAVAVLTDLEPLAIETRAIPLPRTPDMPVVVYSALLFDASAAERAAAIIRDHEGRLGGLGFRIAWSGPWAPYRFVEGSP